MPPIYRRFLHVDTFGDSFLDVRLNIKRGFVIAELLFGLNVENILSQPPVSVGAGAFAINLNYCKGYKRKFRLNNCNER